MLKDIFVPIELPERGKDFTAEEIEAIRQEPFRPEVVRRPRSFRLCLNSLSLSVFEANMRADEPTMEVTNFSVGYKELAGHGLGTHILKEGLAMGKRLNPDLDKLTTGWEHPSVLNTIAKVLGPENVAARSGRTNYGQGYELPLEVIMTPATTRVQWIEATIDPSAI